MTTSREAFDLWSPACRKNFRAAFSRKWSQGWWWKLVLADTRKRVCSRPETFAEFQHLPHEGDYFRIKFKHPDNSWNDVVWLCVSRQDGAVVGEAISGHTYGCRRRMFPEHVVTFHNASKHAKALKAVA